MRCCLQTHSKWQSMWLSFTLIFVNCLSLLSAMHNLLKPYWFFRWFPFCTPFLLWLCFRRPISFIFYWFLCNLTILYPLLASSGIRWWLMSKFRFTQFSSFNGTEVLLALCSWSIQGKYHMGVMTMSLLHVAHKNCWGNNTYRIN